MTTDYEPKDSDIRWLRSVVDSLSVRGMWIAPMGFAFKKTGESELTLVQADPKENVLEMIERTKKIAKKAGIRIVDSREEGR